MKMPRAIILVFLFQILFISLCFCQEYENETYMPVDHSVTDWCKEMHAAQPNILLAEKAYINYFKEHGNEESKWRSIFKRWLADAKLSMDIDGFHLPNPYPPSKFLKMKAPSNIENEEGEWISLGPNFAERSKCNTSSDLSGGFCDRVYINPFNTNNLFAGFSYGGLWVSQDQGDTWQLSDGAVPNGTNTYANRDLYYGEIEASAMDNNLIFAATEYALLKSTNAGVNWTVCPTLNREDSGDTRSYYVALSKSDQNVVLTTFGRKVYRSADGGNNWTMIFDNENGGPNHYYTSQYSNNSTFGIYERTYNFFGLENAANDPNTFYLGVWNTQNLPEIYKSTDGGNSFELLSNLNQKLDRTLPNNLVLKASQNQDNNFFIHSLFTKDSLYAFDQAGEILSRNLINTSVTTFGTEVTALEAFGLNPADENTMYGGFYFASAITKSENGGATFVDQTSGYSGCPKYVHPDVRSIDVQGDLVLIGSDGGLAISKDGMQTVSSDIGREISSIDLWGFTSSPRTDLIAVGCDHGPTKIRRFAGENGWLSVGGGDASDLSINDSNEKLIYFDRAVNYQFKGELDAENNLISDVSINDNVDLNQVAFHPYVFLNAFSKEDDQLIKLENGFTNLTTVSTFSSNINVLRLAPDNPSVFYVLTNDMRLRKSINGGVDWTEITPPLNVSNGETNIRDVVVGANDQEIWIAYGNWQNTAKVFRSTDGGATWENRTTENLPVTPVSQMVYQPGTDGGIYLAFAGNAGVWYRNNTMSQWEEIGNGLPTMGYIRNVFAVPNKGKIRIGSSRGVWENDLFEASKPVANFATENNNWYCGFLISFVQNSTHAPGEVSYQWDFPGGTPESTTEAEPFVRYDDPGFYTVSLTVTDQDGNSDTQTLVDFLNIQQTANCIPTDVTDLEQTEVKVFPVPAQKTIVVELPELETNINVKLVNALGQTLLQQSLQNKISFQLDIETLPVGIYFLEIEGKKKYQKVKVVKD